MKEESLELKLRLPINSIHGIILKRISSCKTPYKDIIPFPRINYKLGTSLQINKKQIWELLLFFRDLGLLEVIKNHGVILNYKIVNENVKLTASIKNGCFK